MTQQEVRIDFRPLNVVLAPGSKAHRGYAVAGGLDEGLLAPTFQPRPDLDLTNHRGRTIADLTFVNCYLGGNAAWQRSDRGNIDQALDASMSDANLQGVIAQYYSGPISSRMLPSIVVDGALHGKFFKDVAEQTTVKLAADGALGDADPANTVINMMLPKGIVLVDGNSDGSQERRAPGLPSGFEEDDEAADSTQGLGGYHGSVHDGTRTLYYAVGVYSDGNNGIVAFDEPWKNVCATFYHELNEARTDPDVEEVIRTGNMRLLGWYSRKGGEIGDIPMALAGADLSRVMQEITLVEGGTAPIQLMWSNRDHGPAAR